VAQYHGSFAVAETPPDAAPDPVPDGRAISNVTGRAQLKRGDAAILPILTVSLGRCPNML